jgi:hypothetical protein
MFARVQNTESVWGGRTVAQTATYDSTPTAGNLLVAMLSHRSTDGTADPTLDGWTRVALSTTTSDGGNKGVAIFYRISTGSEGSVTGPVSWHTIQLFEFATGGKAVEFVDSEADHSGATAVDSFTLDVPQVTASESLAVVNAMHRAPVSPDSSDVSFDSGFEIEQLVTRGSDFGGNEAVRSWRNDVNDTPDNDVTWTHPGTREVAMAVASFQEASGALDVPGNFAFDAHASLRQLDGSWTASAGADSYDVQVEYKSEDIWVPFTDFNTAGTSFQLDSTDGVAWATTYRCRVRAVAN